MCDGMYGLTGESLWFQLISQGLFIFEFLLENIKPKYAHLYCHPQRHKRIGK